MQPAEDAVAVFDFVFAQIGDGFKLAGDSFRQLHRRRHGGVIHRLAFQPLPKPAGFERVGVKLADEDGVLSVAVGAVVVIRPEIKLVYRLI